MKLYQHIASAIGALKRCESPQANASQSAHVPVWRDRLDGMQQELPRGSGFDSYPAFDLDKSSEERITILGSYHRMDDNGTYCGWSDYRVIVTPSLVFGFKLRIVGGDESFKDYAEECFHAHLSNEYDSLYFAG